MQMFSSFISRKDEPERVKEVEQGTDLGQFLGRDERVQAQYHLQPQFERVVDEVHHIQVDHNVNDNDNDVYVEMDPDQDQDLDPELDLEAEGTMTTGTTAITSNSDPARSPSGGRHGGLITPRGSFSEMIGAGGYAAKQGTGLGGVMPIRVEDEDDEEVDEGLIVHGREYPRQRIISSQPMRRETPVAMTTTTTTTPLAETFGGLYNSSSVYSKDTITATPRPDSPLRSKDDLDPLTLHRGSLTVTNAHKEIILPKRSYSQNDPSYHPLVDADTPLSPFPLRRIISRTSTPPLTTRNLELVSAYPEGSAPTCGPASISTPSAGARRRWGLERTASWASQISGSPRSTASSDDYHRGQGVEGGVRTGRAGTGIKRPGFVRSRTANAGTLGSMGKTSSGLARAAVGTGSKVPLQRSRSYTVGPGSERFSASQSAGSSGSHLHHPYRFVLTGTTGESVGSSSAVSTTSTSAVVAQNRRAIRELASPLFAPDEYFGESSITHPAGATGEPELLSTNPTRRTQTASSRLLRPKLWRGISGKSNLGSTPSNALNSPALFGDEVDPLLQPTPRPASRGPSLASSSRSTVETKVDEYMMDMDKWVLGTGEVASACAGSPIRSVTPIPEVTHREHSSRGGLEGSSAFAGPGQRETEEEEAPATLDGKDGKMWVDGCEVLCDDGTACLATHEAYLLNVQLLHR
jgi:hypothetical protein